MFGNLLQRMIFWELVKVFGLALLAITGILLMAGIIAEATQQGLSPGQLMAIIPLLIPSTLPYTIPATTLFATCVVYGRLSGDNEILAIKAAGVNIRMVVWPAVLLGLLMSAATWVLYMDVIPATTGVLKAIFLSDVEESLYAVLRRDHAINERRFNYAVWVRQVQDRKLKGALFKRRDAKGNYDVVAIAREAELRVHMSKRQILLHMWNGHVIHEGGASIYFDDRMWEVGLPDAVGMDRPRRPRELTWGELHGRLEELKQKQQEIDQEIAKTLTALAAPKPHEDLPKHFANLKDKRRSLQIEYLGTIAEMYLRPALALGCLGFILVGCPVGIYFSRNDYLSSFVTCFLPIVFIYYPLMLCGTNLAKEGRIPPALTIFAADLVIGVAGLILFNRLLKR